MNNGPDSLWCIQPANTINNGPDSLWWMLVKVWRWLLSFLSSLIPRPSQQITFDTGHKVKKGWQIAEGGFSYVFEATDDAGHKYALKQIYLGDSETLQACRNEAGLHRSVCHHNLMPPGMSQWSGTSSFCVPSQSHASAGNDTEGTQYNLLHDVSICTTFLACWSELPLLFR